MPTVLEQAVAHIRAGAIEKATPLLIEVLKQNPRDENAWLWMSRCVTETEQKRYCFEKVLKLNPQNQYAIRSLRQLSKPVPPPTPPKVSQPQPVHPVPKQSLGITILTFAAFAAGVFLVVLFLYAWWITR
jgi:hypothetical protein